MDIIQCPVWEGHTKRILCYPTADLNLLIDKGIPWIMKAKGAMDTVIYLECNSAWYENAIAFMSLLSVLKEAYKKRLNAHYQKISL